MANTKATRKAAKAAVSTVKRAAIYVRVSTEKQAKTKASDGQEAEEKESPQAQERDCRALAERQGYIVTAVYRDVEKYRVGKRLVEPSGTRGDRPALRQMLADARVGKFDVILAWREDRLYRSYRPMLDVLDCLEDCKPTTGLTIELAKEFFDPNLAPVKAWAARQELQARRDRMSMGIMGRLAQGKAWPSITPYGYMIESDRYVENPDESKWVKLIWQMFGDNEPVSKIRKRLIAGGAKQRKDDNRGAWQVTFIRNLMKHESYHTGALAITWDGKDFTLPVPAIVDAKTAANVKARLARYKSYPAGNLKAAALAAGFVYCEKCNVKMSVVKSYTPDRKHTKLYHYLFYRCNCMSRENQTADCAKTVRIDKIDQDVWQKLYKQLTEPGELEATIQQRVTELQAQEFDASAECEKLTARLDELAMMRQEAIALHQEKVITKADLELRLTSLSFEQVERERQLREKRLLVGNHAERLMAVARKYREDVSAGLIDANREPESPDEAAEIFKARRDLVETYVKRVDVQSDKTTKVEFEFNFAKVLEDESLCISAMPLGSQSLASSRQRNTSLPDTFYE